LTAFAVGVGLGSLTCEKLAAGRIELGLVPLGTIGLTLFAVDLYFAQTVQHAVSVATPAEFIARPGSFRILADTALLGAFGGLYSVPLFAMMQERADRKHMSRIVAGNNRAECDRGGSSLHQGAGVFTPLHRLDYAREQEQHPRSVTTAFRNLRE
jgi:hypothetical protein